MVLGFLKRGGLSSSSWAGGRHLHGEQVALFFFLSQQPGRRDTKRVLSTAKGGGREASESVLSRLRGMR